MDFDDHRAPRADVCILLLHHNIGDALVLCVSCVQIECMRIQVHFCFKSKCTLGLCVSFMSSDLKCLYNIVVSVSRSVLHFTQMYVFSLTKIIF